MLKLPDFMRIDPNDFNAENIRRMSSYGKPQEDFLTGAVQQFQNSALFKERKVAREYFENETEIDNKIRFYFNREGLQIIDNTVSNVKLRHSFYRKLVNQKVNYLLSKAFTIKCKNEEFEQILQGYFNKKFLRRYKIWLDKLLFPELIGFKFIMMKMEIYYLKECPIMKSFLFGQMQTIQF